MYICFAYTYTLILLLIGYSGCSDKPSNTQGSNSNEDNLPKIVGLSLVDYSDSEEEDNFQVTETQEEQTEGIRETHEKHTEITEELDETSQTTEESTYEHTETHTEEITETEGQAEPVKDVETQTDLEQPEPQKEHPRPIQPTRYYLIEPQFQYPGYHSIYYYPPQQPAPHHQGYQPVPLLYQPIHQPQHVAIPTPIQPQPIQPISQPGTGYYGPYQPRPIPQPYQPYQEPHLHYEPGPQYYTGPPTQQIYQSGPYLPLPGPQPQPVQQYYPPPEPIPIQQYPLPQPIPGPQDQIPIPPQHPQIHQRPPIPQPVPITEHVPITQPQYQPYVPYGPQYQPHQPIQQSQQTIGPYQPELHQPQPTSQYYPGYQPVPIPQTIPQVEPHQGYQPTPPIPIIQPTPPQSQILQPQYYQQPIQFTGPSQTTQTQQSTEHTTEPSELEPETIPVEIGSDEEEEEDEPPRGPGDGDQPPQVGEGDIEPFKRTLCKEIELFKKDYQGMLVKMTENDYKKIYEDIYKAKYDLFENLELLLYCGETAFEHRPGNEYFLSFIHNKIAGMIIFRRQNGFFIAKKRKGRWIVNGRKNPDYVKLYTNDSYGNDVLLTSEEYYLSFTSSESFKFTFKDGVRCTKIVVFDLTWVKNPEEEFPLSCSITHRKSIILFFKNYFYAYRKLNGEYKTYYRHTQIQ